MLYHRTLTYVAFGIVQVPLLPLEIEPDRRPQGNREIDEASYEGR